jgi:hypothetical protein
MTPADFARTFLHSELGPVTLDRNLALYAWHGDHHVAHITALRARMGCTCVPRHTPGDAGWTCRGSKESRPAAAPHVAFPRAVNIPERDPARNPPAAC